MEPAEVVREVWGRIDGRDWHGLAELLDDAVQVEWPVSGERISGSQNVVAVNAEYPEGWSIRVLRVVADGDQVVSEVEVPMENAGVFRVASFWTVRDGRVTHAREYWTSLGADQPPAWRSKYTTAL